MKMSKKTLVALIAALVVAAVLLAFLLRNDSDTSGDIEVATILGLTGENAAYGIKMRNGLELAVDVINEKGVNGRKIKLIIEDSQWNPKNGVSIYRRLYDVRGIRLFSAICGSTVALAVAENSKDDEVVIVDAISTAPKLTSHGGPKYFRVAPSDAVAGQKNVEWALSAGAKSFLIVYVEDDWGTSYKDALVADLKAKGHEVMTLALPKGGRNYRVEIQKAGLAQADAVFLAIYASMAVPFIQQARSERLGGTFYGGDNLSSSDLMVAGADAIEGIRLSLPGDLQSDVYKRFHDAYVEKFGEEPDVFALKSYDALMLLAHAIEQVGTEPSSIANYLRGIEGYDGASGPLAFDKNGDLATQTYRRMQYVSGKLEPWKP